MVLVERPSWVTGCLASVLVTALPATASAEDSLADLLLYGVRGQSADLVRYDFAKGQYHPIGTIRGDRGQVMTGIEAMAYVPHSLNLIAFWQDDSADGRAHMLYINSINAIATKVGGDLDRGRITCATVGHGHDAAPTYGPLEATPEAAIRDLRLFAVQQFEAEGPAAVDFRIENGRVVPGEQAAVKVKVLGAAISYGQYYDVPVTTYCKVNDLVIEPFGDSSRPVEGNVNDGSNPRAFVLPETYPAGSHISVCGTSWIKRNLEYSGDLNSHWQIYMTADSPQVIVLRNGDPVPNIAGFLNQHSLVYYIVDYIDTDSNTIALDENQAILLFELGTTDRSSSDCDHQDLVVLLTLARSRSEFAPAPTGVQQGAPSRARLLEVDHTSGTCRQIMTLARVYDGLAAVGSKFYATSNGQLWQLDPATGQETMVGPTHHGQVLALEGAGAGLYGFASINDRFSRFNMANGAPIGDGHDIGISDMTTMIFMRRADQPDMNAMD